VKLGAFAAAGVVAAAMVLSCSSSDENGGGGAGGDAATGVTYASSNCGKCASSACANQRQVCLSEPSCAAFLECLDQCPVDASGDVVATCEAGCPDAQGEAATKAKEGVNGCRGFGPGAQCADCGADGGVDPLPPEQCGASAKPPGCTKCLDENCCVSANACVTNQACIGLNTCWSACGDLDATCKAGCLSSNAAGSADYLRFQACGTDKCGAECGASACNACVRQNCRNTQLACDLDPDCFVVGLCYVDCPMSDGACFKKCRDSAPTESLQRFDAFSLCRSYACPSEC
jgi:hypothetical protein